MSAPFISYVPAAAGVGAASTYSTDDHHHTLWRKHRKLFYEFFK
jgi:hypothetical protein